MEIKKIEKKPEEMITVFLQAILMPNNELISNGKSVGFNHDLKYIYVKTE